MADWDNINDPAWDQNSLSTKTCKIKYLTINILQNEMQSFSEAVNVD
jgi:hypothetical protein